MRKIRRAQHFLCLLLALIVISCTKDATVVRAMLPAGDPGAVLKYHSKFSKGPCATVRGNAAAFIQDSIPALSLNNFSALSGPEVPFYNNCHK